MCGPMRGAVAGAIVFEGWAPDLDAATELAGSGGIEFHPNHHFGAVGPMTGMTTVSMPLFVVENTRFSNRAYCAINEGLGKVMPSAGMMRAYWPASPGYAMCSGRYSRGPFGRAAASS